MQSFYSRGKLLLTGEYVVLDGALALALPTKFGQYLNVQPIDSPKLHWKSIDENENLWFECSFKFSQGKIIPDSKTEVSIRLTKILNAVNLINKDFFIPNRGFNVTTKLEFSRSWGLGTSSTLINNIASWANIDPYKLLELSFGGSGYDIACAQNSSALTYQLKGNERLVKLVDFNPKFKDNLFFVHLNRKQDSRKGIANYNLNKKELKNSISEINEITSKILSCQDLSEFESLITDHEKIISDIIKTNPVKETLFKDYKGAIKSLGAWGGDFILVTGKLENMDYFKNEGFHTILSFENLLQ